MIGKHLLWAFVVYSLVYEAIVWIGGMYVILTFNWSPWWVLMLFVLSSSQLSPKTFRSLFEPKSTIQ